MYVAGDLTGIGVPARKFRIGATVVAGQIVVKDAGGPGEITDPATVNSYADGIGVAYEAGTYATSSPHVFVKASYSPTQLIRGRASGGTAADTAHTSATLLTQDTASTTVLTDTAVATLDYIQGYLVGLTGNCTGHIRVITGQSDNTSTTVTVAFPASIAVNDTAIRTYAPMTKGVELTTDYCQWNNLIAAGEALNDALGEALVWDVLIDDQSCHAANQITIKTPTNPCVELVCVLYDHFFNPID